MTSETLNGRDQTVTQRLLFWALMIGAVSALLLGAYLLLTQWYARTWMPLESLAAGLSYVVAGLCFVLLRQQQRRPGRVTLPQTQALDLLPYPAWIKDRFGRYQHANPAFRQHWTAGKDPKGASDSEVLDVNLAELFDDADSQALAHRQFHAVEMKLQRNNAAVQWLRLEWHPLFDTDGETTGVMGLAFDITPYKMSDAQLRADQWVDPLTGFANQPGLRNFLERLDDDDATNLWCVHVDIDHFKVLNDSMGGEAGDQLLRQLSARLSEQSENGDFLARVAADEFVLFWQGPDEDEQGDDDREQRLNDLHVQLTQPFNIGGSSYSFTVSIGVARSPRHGNSANELHRNAGVALFNAKKLGRNQVHWYHSGYEDQARRRLNKAQTLTRALQQHDMEIHLQPRIDCRTGEIQAMECLVRLQSDGGDLIYPGHFIDLAEHNGSIRELDRWVLEQTLMLIARQLSEGAQPVKLGVNFSVQSISRDTLHYLRAWHERQPEVLQHLEVEVTEHQLPEQNVEFRELLEAFRELGVTLALDDFGTGYANLSRLPDLPFQVVKLDRTFIHDLPQSDKQMAVVKAVVDLCQSLSIQVVAEGVETEAELNAVAGLGCHLIQGFVYARPRPLSEAIEWFEQRRLLRQ